LAAIAVGVLPKKTENQLVRLVDGFS
jgi:hypothetical protein